MNGLTPFGINSVGKKYGSGEGLIDLLGKMVCQKNYCKVICCNNRGKADLFQREGELPSSALFHNGRRLP